MKEKEREYELRDTVGARILDDSKSKLYKTKSSAKNNINNKTSLDDHFTLTVPKNNIAVSHDIVKNILSEDNNVNDSESSQRKNLLSTIDTAISRLENHLRNIVSDKLSGFKDYMTESASPQKGYQNISRLMIGITGNKKDGENFTAYKNEMSNEVSTAISTVSILEFAQEMFDQMADNRSVSTVQSIKGMDSKSSVSTLDIDSISGFDGILSVFAETMGSKIYSSLGLKVKENTDEITRERLVPKLKSELGIMAIMALEEAGLISTNIKSRESNPSNKDEVNYSKDQEKKIKAGDFVPGFKTPSSLIYSNSSNVIENDINTFTITSKGKAFLNNTKIKKAAQALEKELVTIEDNTGIFLTEGSNLTKNIQNQGVTSLISEVPSEQKDAVEHQEKLDRSLSKSTLSLYNVLNGFNMVEDLMGRSEEKDSHIDDRAALKGKNNQIDRSIRILNDVIDATEGGLKKFWLKLYVVTNGRFGIKGGKFDPVADKFHRGFHTFGTTTIKTKALIKTATLSNYLK